MGLPVGLPRVAPRRTPRAGRSHPGLSQAASVWESAGPDQSPLTLGLADRQPVSPATPGPVRHTAGYVPASNQASALPLMSELVGVRAATAVSGLSLAGQSVTHDYRYEAAYQLSRTASSTRACGVRCQTSTKIETRDDERISTPRFTPPLPLLARNRHHRHRRKRKTSIHADSNSVDTPLPTAETDCSNWCSLYFPPFFPRLCSVELVISSCANSPR